MLRLGLDGLASATQPHLYKLLQRRIQVAAPFALPEEGDVANLLRLGSGKNGDAVCEQVLLRAVLNHGRRH